MKNRSLFFLVLLASLHTPEADAATYTIDRTGDSIIDGSGNTGTLRYVISRLNASTDVANTVVFTTGGPISISSLLPEIVRPVVMTTGGGPVEISWNGVAPVSSKLLRSAVPFSLPETLSLSISGRDSAHDLDSSGNLTINGNLGGTFKATSEANNAAGLINLGATQVIINGNITGSITTFSATDNSFGIRGFSGGSSTVKGNITVNGSLAPGSSIRATAGNSSSSAMEAENGGILIYGDLGGVHSATALTFARTFYAYNVTPATMGSLHIHGAVTGTVTATARQSQAFGIVSRYSDVIIDKGIAASGAVGVDSRTGLAYGIYAYHGDIRMNDDLAGTVTASTGNNIAIGLAATDIYIDGAISGRITATASGGGAFGLSNNDPAVGLGIGISKGITATGNVTVSAAGHSAAGLSAGIAGIHGVDTASPLLIAGAVSATASGAAAGVVSIGPMNLAITGTVSGVDTSGQGLGYAIKSGTFDYVGGFTNSFATDDHVAVEDEGRLVGRVDLGAGNDMMVLGGHADISNVSALDGGSGGETTGDRLVLSGWKGQIANAFIGWERIDVLNSSRAIFDLNDSLLLAPSAGQQLTIAIDTASAVIASGTASSRYLVRGSIVDGGLLDLRDGAANDRVIATDAFTGTDGRIGLDVALASGSQSNPDLLDLLVIGSDGTASGIAGGRTSLLVANNSRDGAIRTTEGNGILVIQVNGISTADAFSLDPSNDFRGAEVKLLKGGAEGIGGESWYLVVTRGVSPYSYRVMRLVEPMIIRLGEESIPRFHERQAYGWSLPGSGTGSASWWVRSTGIRFLGEFEGGGERVKATGCSSTTQVGSDLHAWRQGALSLRAGFYAGTGYLQADSKFSGSNAGSVDLFSMSIGGYASLECRGCWFLEGALQASRYDIDAEFLPAAYRRSGHLWGYITSLEAGFRHKATPTFYLEPRAQVVVQHIDAYSMETPAGIARQDGSTGVFGQMGLTGTFSPKGWRFNPFFEMNAVREFRHASPVTYDEIGQSYQVTMDRTRLGATLGITSRSEQPESLKYYIKAGVMAGIDGYGGRDYMISVGIRKSW